jgi:hypothetical protein
MRRVCTLPPRLAAICAASLDHALGVSGQVASAQAQEKQVTFIAVNNLFSAPAYVAFENG